MQITVNYQELAQGAHYLEQKSNDYQQVINQIYARMQQMQSVWKGQDHQAFIAQLEHFRPQLQKIVAIIETYAHFLLYCANEYQKLQQERIARARNLV